MRRGKFTRLCRFLRSWKRKGSLSLPERRRFLERALWFLPETTDTCYRGSVARFNEPRTHRAPCKPIVFPLTDRNVTFHHLRPRYRCSLNRLSLFNYTPFSHYRRETKTLRSKPSYVTKFADDSRCTRELVGSVGGFTRAGYGWVSTGESPLSVTTLRGLPCKCYKRRSYLGNNRRTFRNESQGVDKERKFEYK